MRPTSIFGLVRGRRTYENSTGDDGKRFYYGGAVVGFFEKCQGLWPYHRFGLARLAKQLHLWARLREIRCWMGLDHRQVKDPAEGYLDMDGMEHFIMPCHDEAKCYLSSVPFNFPCFTSHPRSHQQFATLSQKDFDAYETLMAKGLERAIRT